MGKIGQHNNTQYSLVSKSQERVKIPEPVNFDKGNGNIYERDKESKGFIISKKDALEFHGLGYETIFTQFVTKGLAEELALEKLEKDNTRLDERYRSFPTTYLDLGTAVFEERQGGTGICKVKTQQGGLKKTIDSSLNDEYDLTTVVDSLGNVIEPLYTETIFLEPKEILLSSKMAVEDGKKIFAVVSGNDGLNSRAIPFIFETNSDQENLQSIFGSNLNANNGNYTNLESILRSNVFLDNSSTNKTITLNGKIKITQTEATHAGTLTLDIVIYEGGEDFLFKEKINLGGYNPNIAGDSTEYVFNNYKLDILKGESLVIAVLSDTNDGIRYLVTETEIEITENSGEYEVSSNARCLTYKQVAERLIYIITGTKIKVVSELLDNGKLKEDVLSNGFWVRQFPDVIKKDSEEERVIQFTTSLGDLFDHIEALEPMAWWVEKQIDNTYVLRIENLKYTQQNFIGTFFAQKLNTGYNYTQAYDIKRTPVKDNFYSKIELGSKKGGDGYEEVFGLQSVSGRASFKTINTDNESVYTRLSPYRLGDVDVELARRKPFEFFQDTDTKYDSDLVCIRAKRIGEIFTPKKWQDAFEIAPKGIFSVNSCYNLEITPARLLLESHGFMVKVGLYHYPNSSIVFSESNCNSSLITKRINEEELKESPDKTTGNGVILVSRLENARVKPMTVDFKLKITQEIEDNMNEFTDGVPNLFGVVAVNTGQSINYFRMIKTDANDEGTHKFIEAFIQ